MKKLTQYIFERLIINKNYIDPNNFKCVQPDDKGRCISIMFKHSDDETSQYYVGKIAVERYTKDNEYVYIRDYGGGKLFFEKNDNGYYEDSYTTKNSVFDGIWKHILLFGNDAELLLNDLLKNSNKVLSISDFINFKDNDNPAVEFREYDYNTQQYELYTNDMIKKLIKSFKRK